MRRLLLCCLCCVDFEVQSCRVTGRLARCCCSSLSFVALSLLTSTGVTVRPQRSRIESSFLDFVLTLREARAPERSLLLLCTTQLNLNLPTIPLPPRLPHREPSPLCVLQGMSLVIPSGWISPGQGTTRVTTMHGASLTCWTWNTSATTSSTPSTGT